MSGLTTTRPILVTGSHRSGSTWTGRMIAMAPDIGYVHEPFNLLHRPGMCRAEFDTWFPYVCEENEQRYANAIEDCLRFNYRLSKDLGAIRSVKDVLYTLRDYSSFGLSKAFGKRPLLKDPIAVFSAEWLARRFDMEVVVMIRHPAAFVGSIKSARWAYPFDHFLRQPLLMKHHLAEYRPQIEEFARSEQSLVDQAILLWNLIHHMIRKYRQEHPDWTFIKHETLSENPLTEFERIFRKLDIRFSPDIRKKIASYSFAESGKGKYKPSKLDRDSRSNVWTWKTRLTEDEVARVRDGTADIARAFYSEENWVN